MLTQKSVKLTRALDSFHSRKYVTMPIVKILTEARLLFVSSAGLFLFSNVR